MSELEKIEWNKNQKHKMLESIKTDFPDIYEIVLLLLEKGYSNFTKVKGDTGTSFSLGKWETLSSVNIICGK